MMGKDCNHTSGSWVPFNNNGYLHLNIYAMDIIVLSGGWAGRDFLFLKTKCLFRL